MTLDTLLRRTAHSHASDIWVVAGDDVPYEAGESYHWRTRGGRVVHHPSAYAKSGWSNLVYEHSTIHIEVGIEWLRAHAPYLLTHAGHADDWCTGAWDVHHADGISIAYRHRDQTTVHGISVVRGLDDRGRWVYLARGYGRSYHVESTVDSTVPQVRRTAVTAWRQQITAEVAARERTAAALQGWVTAASLRHAGACQYGIDQAIQAITVRLHIPHLIALRASVVAQLGYRDWAVRASVPTYRQENRS